MTRLLLLLAASLLLIAADISEARLASTVILTNNSGSTAAPAVVPFPLSSQGLMDRSEIESDGLNMQLCTTDDDCSPSSQEVIFAPSPVRTSLHRYFQLDTTGGTFTNDTADAGDSDANDVQIWDADPEVDDSVYIGMDETTFRVIHFNVGTAGSGVWTVTWEYYNGSTWVEHEGIADGTQGFTRSGLNSIQYDMPGDWAQVAVNGVTAYWTRARISAYTSTATTPLGTQVWAEHGLFYTYRESLGNNEQFTTVLYTGGQDIRTSNWIVVGDAGLTTSSAFLSPNADDFTFEIRGVFGWEAGGSAKNLVVSTGGAENLTIQWDSAVDGQIDASIPVGASTCSLLNTATGISDYDIHTIEFEMDDGVACSLYVDSVQVATDATVTSGTSWGGSTWEIAADGSMLLIDYFKYAEGSTDPDVSTDNSYQVTDLSSYTSVALNDLTGSIDLTPSFPAFDSDIIGLVSPFASTFTPTSVDPASTDPSFIPPEEFDEFTGSVTDPQLGRSLPLGDMIYSTSLETNISPSFFWHILLAVGTILAILFAGILTRGNVIAAMVSGAVVLTIATSPGIALIHWWVIMVYVIFSVAVILMTKGREVDL